MPPRPSPVLALLLAITLAACSPSFSPLYRDYEFRAEDPPVTERITRALEEAGWQTTPASTSNAIATEERRVRRWGIYSVVVSLEAVPVGDGYVRLYFHPYRRYFTGNRSKIPFLKGSIRHALLNDLNSAFEAQGLHALGTSVDRDRQANAR